MNLKNFYSIFKIAILFTLSNASDFNISYDLVSRYVWRGTDFGNAAAVQPGIETAFGPITVGAWGSWALNGADGGNECDLYASTTVGPVSITLTDYFFPVYLSDDTTYTGDGLFSLSGDDATHTFELSAGADVGPVSVLAAANVSGDDDNSAYLELTYGIFSLGLGNGFYSTDGEFAPVSLGISTNRDNLSVSYIINPDQETSFLVLGISF